MSKAPSMPMYWDAYLADTTHLTTEEHGAYLLLLAAMWRRDGSVPDDDRDNARILGLTPAKWRKVKQRLAPFLEFKNGHISQKNLQKLWKSTQEKIEKNRLNGGKGGRPKSNKTKGLAKANGSVSDNPKETIPEPEPEPDIKEDTDVSLSASPPHANEVSEAVSLFNEAAGRVGWSQIQRMNPNRSKQLRARLKECGGLEGWEAALAKAEASDFLCGRTERPWSGFGFDWFVKAANFTKLMEGNYDDSKPSRAHQHGGGGRFRSSTSDAFAAVAARREAGRSGGHGGGVV
jgi:uncharacterized protein YdaU (DUF1376 family)